MFDGLRDKVAYLLGTGKPVDFVARKFLILTYKKFFNRQNSFITTNENNVIPTMYLR